MNLKSLSFLAFVAFVAMTPAQDKPATDYKVGEVSRETLFGNDPYTLVASARQSVRAFLKNTPMPGFDQADFDAEPVLTTYKGSSKIAVHIGPAMVFFDKAGRMDSYVVSCAELGQPQLSEQEGQTLALEALSGRNPGVVLRPIRVQVDELRPTATYHFSAWDKSGSQVPYLSGSEATVNMRTGQIVAAHFGDFCTLASGSEYVASFETIRRSAAEAFSRFSTEVNHFDVYPGPVSLYQVQYEGLANEVTAEQKAIAESGQVIPSCDVLVRDLDSWNEALGNYSRFFIATVDARTGQTMTLMDASFLNASFGTKERGAKSAFDLSAKCFVTVDGKTLELKHSKTQSAEGTTPVAVDRGTYWSVGRLSKDGKYVQVGDNWYGSSKKLIKEKAFGKD